MTTRQTKYRICPLCEATCGLELVVDGREVTAVRGDDADVFSQGFICPKGVRVGAARPGSGSLARTAGAPQRYAGAGSRGTRRSPR